MVARRRCVHVVALLLAVLQFAVPGVAAVADGLAFRAGAHATAHVESRTERDCVRVHEADCVFCQCLSTSATPAPRKPGSALAAVVREQPRLAGELPRARAFPRPGDPRGPPDVSSI